MKIICSILLSLLLIGCHSAPHSVHFVSYGNHRFKNSRERIQQEALESNWFKTVNVFTPDAIPEFYAEHKDYIEAHQRGGGYWIWKPYIIQQVLKNLSEGEYLVYTDAGCTLKLNGTHHLNRYIKLLESSKHDILSFQTYFIEKDWTKGDLPAYFQLDLDGPHMNSGQILTTALIIKKSPESVRFVDKWLEIALIDNHHLIDDTPSIGPNASSFIEHRHDQSIFSLLIKTEGGLILDDEVQFKTRTKKGSRDKKNPFPFSATRKRG